MQGKKGCYFGFGTSHNNVAWAAALCFIVAGAALLATGIKTVNSCSENYRECRLANGPLADADTDKCVRSLSTCAKPGITQYTVGAVLLACVTLPAFYFCCCAVRPDKQQVHPASTVVSPGPLGDTKQSIDCEKQSTSQQELIASGQDGQPHVYKYEYQSPSVATYVIHPVNHNRVSMGSDSSSPRQVALFPSRTVSVFGPEQEPSRNFNEVRITEAVEAPSGYENSMSLHRQGSMPSPRAREAAATAAAASSPRHNSNANGSEHSFTRSNSARSIKAFHLSPEREPSQRSNSSSINYYPRQQADDVYQQSSPKAGRQIASGSPTAPSSPKIAPLVFHQAPMNNPKRIPSFYDRL